MRTGDVVFWKGQQAVILAEYDHDFVYLDCADHLVHISELVAQVAA